MLLFFLIIFLLLSEKESYTIGERLQNRLVRRVKAERSRERAINQKTLASNPDLAIFLK